MTGSGSKHIIHIPKGLLQLSIILACLALLITPITPVFAADALDIITEPATTGTFDLPDGTYNASYSETLLASGGTPPYAWSVASGSLPAGLSLNPNTGLISGTPTAVDTFPFTVQVIDNNDPAGNDTQLFSITINKADITLTVDDVTVAEDNTATLTATLTPHLSGKTINFSISGTSKGSDTTDVNGVASISGIDVSSYSIGTHSNYITAAFAGDGTYQASSGSADLTIATELAMVTNAVMPGIDGFEYYQSLEASGGSGSYTWTKSSGTLPSGLSLHSSGNISGTPTTAGNYTFTLKATDSNSNYVTRTFYMTVSEPGYLYSWGYNNKGQLGNNSTTNSELPVQSSDLTDNDIVAIAVGVSHTLVVDSNGDVYAWGDNSKYQLGKTTTGTYKTPVKISTTSMPVIVALAAGNYHSLALDDECNVWVWGDNASGQLGAGSSVTSKSTPYKLTSITDVVAISAGYSHSLALKSDGTVWAWGDNTKGQLGNNSATKSYTPVQVKGGEQDGTYLTDIVAIDCGYYFNLALDSDGNVWAWGDNSNGQLGNGSTTSTFKTPVLVDNINDVEAIAAGGYHSLAVDNSGIAYAWGDNAYYQIGDGTDDDADTPQEISDLEDVSAVTAGAYYSMAIDGDGNLYSWGYNNYGQLGLGTTDTVKTPEQVESFDASVITVAAFSSTTLIISSQEVEIPEVNITTSSLDDGKVGVAYSETLSASGGYGSYTWSKSSGTLPPGLTLSSAGKISGTPTTADDYTFTVKATDSEDSSLYDTKSFTVTIAESDIPVTITTESLTNGKVGTAYSKTLAATGGNGTYTWSKSSGTLPPGLTLSTAGKISGTPTTAGSYTFTVKAVSGSLSDTTTFTMTIAPEVTETTVTTSGFTSSGTVKIDQDGYTTAAYKITTSDGKFSLAIPSRSQLLNSSGNPLTKLSAAVLSTLPTAPSGKTVLIAYNFGPDGATFSSPVTATFNYDQDSLPAGIAESSLYLAYYDGSLWQTLASSVNTTNNTVTAQIAHFSTYAILGQVASTATPTATPTDKPSTITPTTTPTTSASDDGKSSFNVWLLVIVIIMVIVILFLLLIIRKLRNS